MNEYNKKSIKLILESNLIIHRWNCGKKTLDFDGAVKDYLKENNVKIIIKTKKYESYDQLIITAKYDFGGMSILFTGYDLETVVKMVIGANLLYLGDKSQYRLNGRTRTINKD